MIPANFKKSFSFYVLVLLVVVIYACSGDDEPVPVVDVCAEYYPGDLTDTITITDSSNPAQSIVFLQGEDRDTCDPMVVATIDATKMNVTAFGHSNGSMVSLTLDSTKPVAEGLYTVDISTGESNAILINWNGTFCSVLKGFINLTTWTGKTDSTVAGSYGITEFANPDATCPVLPVAGVFSAILE